MYITTQENGIINSDNYPRIDVYSDDDTYVLCAFTERDPDQSGPKQRISIAVYNEKVNAYYALVHLYRSLDMEKNTWDSKNVSLFSDIWDKVKQKLSNDQRLSKLVNNASHDIALPDQLTINIPYLLASEQIYDKDIDNKEKEFIAFAAKKISEELVSLLEEDPVIAIRTLNLTWNIEIKSTASPLPQTPEGHT